MSTADGKVEGRTEKTEVGSATQRASHPARSTQRAALLLGYGNVNQAVAECLERERDRLDAFGVRVFPVRALVRDLTKRRTGPAIELRSDAADLLGSDVHVVVEALGGIEPARTLVAAALQAGIPVVSANKTLVAAYGQELRAIASANRTAFAYDAAVLAGVPFLGALARRPLVSAVQRIEAILNGTSHFIVSSMANGASFETVLDEAIARGYAEPDSSADVGGRDAAEKLTILLHLAGRADVRVEDVPKLGLDVLDAEDLAAARRLGGTIKPVALASLEPPDTGAWVGPAFVDAAHPFARLEGVTNSLRLISPTGCRTFSGPGAGPAVTAVTIVDDIVEILSSGDRTEWIPARATHASDATWRSQPPASRWFIRAAGATDLGAADVAEYLAVRRVPAIRIDEERDRFCCLTSPTSADTVGEVVTAIRSGGARVIALPVVEGGRGE